MIPTPTEAKTLWQIYDLPTQKQRHVSIVAEVSRILAEHVEQALGICIQKDLLYVGALLHDIDKNIPKREGEQHPDAAVRVLREAGMNEVAVLVKTHPLHAILDASIAPTTWEEKILFLADKMTKYDVISVDERFTLWRSEPLSLVEKELLEKAYPKVKELEQEIMTVIDSTPENMINICRTAILQQEGDSL
jgi:putative nucleotidyltransferase with HDIG domain